MFTSAAMHRVLLLTWLAVTVVLANTASAQTSLSMTLTVDPTIDIDANGNQTYTALVTNTGLVGATSLPVSFTMPADDIPISGAPSGACSFSPGSSSLTATCALGLLNAGDTASASVVVHPTAVGQKDVSALATESGGGSASASASSQIIEVAISDVKVTVAANPNPAQVNAALTYSLTATNLGDDDADKVFITLVLPAPVQFVSASRGCNHVGPSVICRAGHLAVNGSASVNVTVLPLASGWAYATAGLRLGTPDPTLTNNAVAARVWVNP